MDQELIKICQHLLTYDKLCKKEPLVLLRENLWQIKAQTQFLDGIYSKVPVKQRIWHIANNNQGIILCEHCNKMRISWSNKTGCYRHYCSIQCGMTSQMTVQKRKETNLKEIGYVTNLQLPEHKKARKEEWLLKWGFDNPSKSPIIKARIKKSFQKNWGVDNIAQLPEIQERINRTHFERNGRLRSSQNHIPSEILEKVDNNIWLKEQHYDSGKTLTQISKETGVSLSQISARFDKFAIPVKNPGTSSEEAEIADFIKTIYSGKILLNDTTAIKPKELDIYLPDEKLAIEYNGLFWHSDKMGKDQYYHLNKMIDCDKQGIRLLQIFPHEWYQKQEIVKSRILNALGNAHRIYARQCVTMIIDNQSARKFLEMNHLQGYVSAKFNYGLYYNNELIAVMTFGKPRYNKKYQIELLRFATKLNTIVIGGASKLFKFYIKNNDVISVISYQDLRYGHGLLYEKLGFTKSHRNSPNYWYTKNFFDLLSRIACQKHKLKKLLPNFNPDMTEMDNMALNKYSKVWDCGNDVWIWTR